MMNSSCEEHRIISPLPQCANPEPFESNDSPVAKAQIPVCLNSSIAYNSMRRMSQRAIINLQIKQPSF